MATAIKIPLGEVSSAALSAPGNRPVFAANSDLQFYRVPEAALLLGINRITLYTKVRNGELPPFQSVGGIKGYTAEKIRSIYAQA